MENPIVSYQSVITDLALEVFTTKRQESAFKLRGFGASGGIIEGPCTIIRDLHELRTLEYGTILVCEAALPIVVPFMPFLGGLVTERGGTLSVTSGCARKHDVPAVVGVKGLMGAVRTGDVIRIDGSRGTVDIIREGISGRA